MAKHSKLALGLGVAVAAAVAGTALLPAGDERILHEQTFGPLTDSTLAWAATRPGFAGLESLPVLVLDGSRILRPAEVDPRRRALFERRFAAFGAARGKSVEWLGVPPLGPPPLSLAFHRESGRTRMVAIWRPPGLPSERSERVRPFHRRAAILPPLTAIVLALALRRVFVALAAGVWLGATLVPWFQSAMVPAPPGASSFPDPLLGLWRFAAEYVWRRSLHDRFQLDIIGFVVALNAAVAVMMRGGAIPAMIDLVGRFARGVRSTRLATALLGVAIFFDDYTNCIVVGNTMRPLTDRMRISREKLAYLVDSTAAPVAGLMVVSTWIAYEVSTFAPQLRAVGVTIDPYEIFIRTVPFRFYCLFTLFLLFASILLRRDLGPMLAAERRAGTTGKVLRDGATPLVAGGAGAMEVKAGAPRRWMNALLPLVALLGVTVVQMVRIGLAGSGGGPADLGHGAGLRRALEHTDSARALLHGSLAAWAVAVGLAAGRRILGLGEALAASLRGARAVLAGIAILFLAWAIGAVCEDLGTAEVLVAMVGEKLPPLLVPLILFLLACAVSFATGSSWSTMAILLPNTVALAYTLGAGYDRGPLALTILSIGAVLEGSIFGDHCSPVSDTTVLSSMASASDHLDHVRTQMPYALAAMAAALLCGYLPAALGAPAAACLAAGAAALVVLLLVAGGDPDRGRGAMPRS